MSQWLAVTDRIRTNDMITAWGPSPVILFFLHIAYLACKSARRASQLFDIHPTWMEFQFEMDKSLPLSPVGASVAWLAHWKQVFFCVCCFSEQIVSIISLLAECNKGCIGVTCVNHGVGFRAGPASWNRSSAGNRRRSLRIFIGVIIISSGRRRDIDYTGWLLACFLHCACRWVQLLYSAEDGPGPCAEFIEF